VYVSGQAGASRGQNFVAARDGFISSAGAGVARPSVDVPLCRWADQRRRVKGAPASQIPVGRPSFYTRWRIWIRSATRRHGRQIREDGQERSAALPVHAANQLWDFRVRTKPRVLEGSDSTPWR
jgi:hypothetical protein